MTDKQEMQCFEYAPEEEDQSDTQIARSLMGYKNKRSEDVCDNAISPSVAFEKFAGKVFNASSTVNTKSVTTKEAVLSTPNGKIETPLEKYNRLKSELEKFHKDLSTMDEADAAVSALFTNEITALQTVLQAIANDPKMAPFLQADYPLTSQTVTGKNVSAKLTKQLSDYASQAQEQKNKQAAETKSEHQGLTYELYMSNYQTNDLANLTGLDQRLSRLEKVIGMNTDNLPSCFPDILTGILFLQRSLTSFKDPQKREPILRRMKTLTGELELLHDQKTNLHGTKMTEYEDKIKALYVLLPTWDAAALQLPLVLARLQSVKDVVDVGGMVEGTLDALEKEHTSIDAAITAGQAALNAVALSLSDCVKTVQKNVDTLEKKFDEAAKKYNQ